MKSTNLRCFVAMAIRDGANQDTNVLHFTVLKPLLKRRLGITAFRIDELHHNENIDIRLLREIDRSQLLIADLTYERPSVYFEAGYALGQKIPVVYTSRSDHLARHPDHQIHFDLRQRNIVPWKSPTDREFARRLIARIRATLTPLLRNRDTAEKDRREHDDFLRQSPESRSTLLVAAATTFLRRNRMKLDTRDREHYPYRLRGYRLRGTIRELATVHVFPSITKSHLEFAHGWDSFYSAPDLEGMRSTTRHTILVSEGMVTRKRVETVFRDYAMAGDKTWAQEPAQDRAGRPDQSFLHVIDGVRSAPMLTRLLSLLGSHVLPRR
jgi:hypothetical protein